MPLPGLHHHTVYVRALVCTLLQRLKRLLSTSFTLTLIAAICFAGMLALFALGNNPLNQQIATWTLQTLPANWREIRNAWDGFHAASSALAALALTSLLIATLSETSSSGLPTKGLQRADHRKERDLRDPHVEQGD